MKPIILIAVFPAILFASNCWSQQEDESAASSQTGQTVEPATGVEATISDEVAPAQDSEPIIDKAPSGNEQAEKMVGAETGASVTIPGADAPVSESRQGNQISLDFSVSDPSKADEKDTTIIIDREQPQVQPDNPEPQVSPDRQDAPGSDAPADGE